MLLGRWSLHSSARVRTPLTHNEGPLTPGSCPSCVLLGPHIVPRQRRVRAQAGLAGDGGTVGARAQPSARHPLCFRL